MSGSGSGSSSGSGSGSGPGRREVAYRLFAAEFDDAEFSYSESDEERAPNYVVTPTGARVNRLFAVGVLTEVEDVNPEMVRGRVVDPTGAFVTYAGQYQPEALAFLERADPPAFIALSGKARTYEPEDSDLIYTSVRPETVSGVDSETRDRWVVTAAERTIERIGVAASAIESGLSGDRLQAALSEAGVDDRLAEGIALALDYYGTTPAYLEALRDLAVDAVRVVAGERDEVGRLELAPGEGGGDAGALATLDLSASTPTDAQPAAEPTEDTADVDSAGGGVGTEPEPEQRQEAGDEPTEPGTAPEETPGVVAGAGSETSEPTAGAAEPGTGPEESGGGDDVAEPTDAERRKSTGDADDVEEELEDFDPGEFELDEEERREVEEEFGTEFSTAGEVESSGAGTEAAGIDGSEATEPNGAGSETGETGAEAEAEAEPETDAGTASEPKAEPGAGPSTAAGSDASEPEPEFESEPTGGEDVDLTDAVMDAMERLDDGEGTDRDVLVSTVADERGVEPDEIEGAIQDALMDGRCYEPSDGTLKSI
jgi:hypothetical protein